MVLDPFAGAVEWLALQFEHAVQPGTVPAHQPGMILKSSDDKSLKFDFDKHCAVNAKKEMHMHALTITFNDPDTITQDWVMYENGKAKDEHPFTLKRVKS